MANHQRQRSAPRLSCEGLETREMLNAAMPALVPAAEIHTLERSRHAPAPVLPNLQTPQLLTTVPANGDTNPYGVAFVPSQFPPIGPLHPGDLLVSNFNNKTLQGLGTTIVQITPQGNTTTFYQGPPGIGFTNTLAVSKRGYVIAGYVPTTDGTPATVQPGGFLILGPNGQVLGNIQNSTLLAGPWSATLVDRGKTASLFVSNVLSGTVSRYNLIFQLNGGSPVIVQSAVQIASGFPHHTDPGAIVLGPAGSAYDAKHDVLYVVSEADNSIHVIPHAVKTKTDRGTGTVLVQDATHLHGPLGLAFAPNGNLVVANADSTNVDPNQPSELVEYTPRGQFVAQKSIDPANGGAFTLAFGTFGGRRVLATVDDNTPGLQVYPLG